MSLKSRFLQLPIKAQIFTSLIIIIAIVATLIIIVSVEFATVHERYMFSKKKEYFFNMKQQIIESNIFLMNLILLQYEYLIKSFNYQFFYYLKNQFEFAGTSSSGIFVDNSKINIYDPTKNIAPDYNPLINDDSINVYFYSRLKDKIINGLIGMIKSNYLFYLNNMKGTSNFRIPFYGNLKLLGIYIVIFPQRKFFISLNKSQIKDIYNRFNGNMNKFVGELNEKSEYNYNYYKKYFINYESKELYFIDIMYKIRHYIFENYKKIKDESDKEEYIREQSIYFQNIFYENDTSMFFDGWNSKNSQFHGGIDILRDYLNFILFHLT